MNELVLIAEQIHAARFPEAVFGVRPEDIQFNFRRLAKAVHPDTHGNDKVAVVAMEKLNVLRATAEARIKDGSYGKKLPLPEYELIDLNGWKVQRKPFVGDVADIYLADRHVVKVARSADDNDLILAERKALSLFDTEVTTVVRAGFPKLLGDFKAGRREANVVQRAEGFMSAQEVHAKLPVVNPRHLVWMFKRLLVLLDWSHHCGLVHGAILPQHVMLYPDNDGSTEYLCAVCDATTNNPVHCGKTGTKVKQHHPSKHTVRLVDWCYSVEYKNRTRLSSWVPAWKAHYPPELLEKKFVGPASDIYMAARLIDYLGGASLPGELQDVLKKCSRPRALERYQEAMEAFNAWTIAARTVYGASKWVDFDVPK